MLDSGAAARAVERVVAEWNVDQSSNEVDKTDHVEPDRVTLVRVGKDVAVSSKI